MTKSKGAIAAVSLAVVAILVVLFWWQRQGSRPPTPSGGEVRVLAWVGYEEQEIVEPFEREFGVKVRTETFTGADKMFAKLSQAPDAYDVVVIDPEYIEKLDKAGLLSDLDESDFDFSDYIEPLREFPLCWRDGNLKAVLVRFGINAIVYNTEKITREEASSYQVLMLPKVKGRVGIWDWYLPSMGCLSRMLGFDPPYELSDKQFDQLTDALTELRPQVRAVMGSFSDINAALARGDIWVVLAHGEHTAAVLADEGHPIDWVVPKEGGIMWIETLGIPPRAKNRDAALKYIHYIQRPEVMAALTWRRAYRSNTPSAAAIALLTPQQQAALKVHDGTEAAAMVRSVNVRMLPTNAEGESLESEWQAAWTEFKAGQ
ncbi:MAG: spermidine/putrescine ABC transporter substrate-binding protein [Planctomycetes bacterium]|nr:spermidine/putrescine ABC transporter substrate-binding protein [Planctomycetota bacterium]